MSFNVRQIFAALNDAQVAYVVVGGLAGILHGYLRATADLGDIEKLERIRNGERVES